ncbi:MAG: MATE family efflux transporter [Ruminococcaceae bacterium]|nr:MATE family efflux transporter [Oscillospiraceae bacterium]
MLPMIFTLAWPTMLEQLMQTTVQYMDTAMVGSLGTEATAAIGSTTTINWLIGSTISAISVGFLAFISQSKGAGDMSKTKKASAQAVLAVIVSGLLFTAITLLLSPVIPVWMQVDVNIRAVASQYFFIIYAPMLFRAASIIFGTVLRAVGDTKTPMLAGIWVNITNVVLNFFFIFKTRTVNIYGFNILIPGADLGVIGAGIASAVSFVLGGIIITVALFRHPLVSPKGQSFKPDMSVIKPCLKVAFPNALQRFATSLGYVVFAAMVNSLGEISTAAHTIANTVESAFYIPGYGMQTAAATLAGNAVGAKDEKKVKDLSKMILFVEVLLMIFSGAMLFIFAPNLMGIFSKDAKVIELGTFVLRMVACSEPFYGISIIVEGMMQGMGKTVMPFVCNVTGMWLIRIVGTFICTQLLTMGLISAWACMILHNLAMCVMFSIYYITGKYLPKEKFL